VTTSTMADVTITDANHVNGAAQAFNPQMSAAPVYPAAPAPQTPVETPRPKRRSRRKVQNALTFLVYLLATVASADGMWTFFGAVLHMDYLPLRASVFSIFEAAVLVSALRARQARLDDTESKGGVDALAVWVFAALSGVFSASHETQLAARGVRLVLPLLAAYMFERSTSAEQGDARQDQGKRRKRLALRLSPERILVALGLADPTDRNIETVNRDRIIARLATLSVRQTMATNSRDRTKAAKAFQAALEKANERYGLAVDLKLMAQLRASIALLLNSGEATSPEAVQSANPWTRTPAVRAASSAQTTSSQSAGRGGRAGRQQPPPARVRRSPAETAAEASRIKAEEPDITMVELAQRLGYTGEQPDRGLRAALDKASGNGR